MHYSVVGEVCNSCQGGWDLIQSRVKCVTSIPPALICLIYIMIVIVILIVFLHTSTISIFGTIYLYIFIYSHFFFLKFYLLMRDKPQMSRNKFVQNWCVNSLCDKCEIILNNKVMKTFISICLCKCCEINVHSWSECYDNLRRTAGDRQPTTKLSNPIGCMRQAIYLPIFQHINGLQ